MDINNQISQQNQSEQKDFWDKLQMDIMSSNQNLTHDDYLSFVERNFMFTLFFRGCSPLEITISQKLFNLKEYAYIIMFEINDLSKTNLSTPLDEIKFFHTIKNALHNVVATIGPMITNRFTILINHDEMCSDEFIREESAIICNELFKVLEAEFNFSVKAGIGSMQNIHSIYPSFVDALACMYYSPGNISIYLDLKQISDNASFDYLETEKHLVEAIRLRKTEAYDYFGIIMEWIKPMHDDSKRNKIFEILVLANHAMQLDSHTDIKYINYSSYVKQFMELSGNELIEFAYQCFIFITSYVKPQTTIDYTNHIVKATREYLESHYADDISLEDMAAQVNISPQYFSKLIKKTTGFNFIDWLSMLRVKKAKDLLTNTNLTVKEVCFMVGYKDPNYFSRIFKKRIGITPSEYVKTSTYLNNKS